nr:MAG TPA: hypothetical protein [Caudoviricetes sp.]
MDPLIKSQDCKTFKPRIKSTFFSKYLYFDN